MVVSALNSSGAIFLVESDMIWRVLRYFSTGLLAAVLLLPVGVSAQSERVCPPLERKYGPFDYLNPSHRAQHLGVVEHVHFTEPVRNLRKSAAGRLAGDLEYVLNWFPNHHGALDSFSRLAVRERSQNPMGAKVPIECRFQWAAQVNPGDSMVPMIGGLYYFRLGRYETSRTWLEKSIEMAPDNANARYNLGLVLVRLKDYPAAVEHAKYAYALGFPLPGLKNALARAGYSLGN